MKVRCTVRKKLYYFCLSLSFCSYFFFAFALFPLAFCGPLSLSPCLRLVLRCRALTTGFPKIK